MPALCSAERNPERQYDWKTTVWLRDTIRERSRLMFVASPNPLRLHDVEAPSSVSNLIVLDAEGNVRRAPCSPGRRVATARTSRSTRSSERWPTRRRGPRRHHEAWLHFDCGRRHVPMRKKELTGRQEDRESWKLSPWRCFEDHLPHPTRRKGSQEDRETWRARSADTSSFQVADEPLRRWTTARCASHATAAPCDVGDPMASASIRSSCF